MFNEQLKFNIGENEMRDREHNYYIYNGSNIPNDFELTEEIIEQMQRERIAAIIENESMKEKYKQQQAEMIEKIFSTISVSFPKCSATTFSGSFRIKSSTSSVLINLRTGISKASLKKSKIVFVSSVAVTFLPLSFARLSIIWLSTKSCCSRRTSKIKSSFDS